MPLAIRSVLSVLGGFAAMALFVGVATAAAVRLMLPAASGTPPQPTPAYLAVNLLYSGLAAFLGGYVAGVIAGRAPAAHAAVLAALVLVMSVLSMRQLQGQQPRGYQWTLAVAMPLLVVAGGLVCAALRRNA